MLSIENSSKKNTKILLLLFVGVLMGALDISVVGPCIPAIEKSMLLNGRELSWIFSIYILFHIFGIPIMSKVSDVHGRKLIYVSSLLIFALGSLLVSFSNEINLLLSGRAIQGFGSSGIFPVAAATIGDIYPANQRGKKLGILGAVYGIAFIIGPLLAGLILYYFNWNTIFLINLPIAAIMIFFSIRLIPGKSEKLKQKINWNGIILLMLVLGSFIFAINMLDTENILSSIGSWLVLPFLLFLLILTPILIIYEKSQKASYLNMAFFKSKQLRLVGLISFGLGIFQSSVVFIPKLAVDIFNTTHSQASLMLLPLVLATAIIPPISGWLLNKIGSRIIILVGLIFAAVSLYLFSALPNTLIVFYVAEAGLGLGLTIRVSMKYIILNEVRTNDRGTSIGMMLLFILLGQLIGATLIGITISGSVGKSHGFGFAFLLLTIITSLLVFLSFFLKTRRIEISK